MKTENTIDDNDIRQQAFKSTRLIGLHFNHKTGLYEMPDILKNAEVKYNGKLGIVIGDTFYQDTISGKRPGVLSFFITPGMNFEL